MATRTTKFRALRNFLRSPGVDVVAGEILELTDAEVRSLIWMAGTVEPVETSDRSRLLARKRVTWEKPKHELAVRRGGYADNRDRALP